MGFLQLTKRRFK